jgi:hypothetical protein
MRSPLSKTLTYGASSFSGAAYLYLSDGTVLKGASPGTAFLPLASGSLEKEYRGYKE